MSADARSILDALQAAIDARDLDALVSLFDESEVLIGTAADARDPEAIRAYLTAVATQPGSLRWEWRDVVVFHEEPGSIGFAGFGEVVLADENNEQRFPIRGTFFAVETPDGWKFRQFHGSIPATGL